MDPCRGRIVCVYRARAPTTTENYEQVRARGSRRAGLTESSVRISRSAENRDRRK